MTTLFSGVQCLECGHLMKADLLARKCDQCGGTWLDAVYDYDALPTDWPELVSRRGTNLWRYHELLPFPETMISVSLGEGWTPLTRAEGLQRQYKHPEIWIKDERQQPTGSFKDRQAAGTVSVLKANGIPEMVLASTGNAAAAYAAFCARAGIKLWVFLTSSVPTEKMRELALYGAEVVKITGTYDQAKDIAADFAARRKLHFDRGAKAIPGKESFKTIGFEIAEQLGWRAPDWYVQAVSGGIGPLGVIKSFQELYRVGLVDRVPKVATVQVDGCAPMVRSWEQGLERAINVEPDTLITVLATGKPGFAYQILKKAADQYGGTMISVSDGDAFRAMRRVARLEGISVEPAASVAFAGLERLINEGVIRPDESVVVNCSGHTFSAEKHALEDRYILNLDTVPADLEPKQSEGLVAALEQLDEQVTSIVIIDDNPNDSRLIRRVFQNHKNYRVFEAHNGPDGIDLVRQRRPGLVVLDLTLPDMDGFTILGELKSDLRTRDIPVIIISAKNLTSEEWAYLKNKTDSIWQKGNFSPLELVGHVVKMLDEDGQEEKQPPTPTSQDEKEILDAFGLENRKKILVVDDNVWDTRLMRRLFEARQRFEVVEAHTAGDALQSLSRFVPDLILLDLMLPDISGIELIDIFRGREATARTPIVVVSAMEMDGETRNRMQKNVDSIWAKGSLDRSSLLAHVEELLVE